jgi:mono/diheme cytochrome c family protein
VVVLLAGGSMAAGWWLFHGPLSVAPPPAGPELARREAKRPEAQVAAVTVPQPAPAPAAIVKEPPSPTVERPPAKPASPPPMPKADVPRPPLPPAPKPPPAVALTFQKDILPLFQAKCVSCHGANNKLKGGLDVRSISALLKGGDSGPAIDRASPEQSAVWDSVATGKMPPGKNKLTESEKKKLHDWLAGGVK